MRTRLLATVALVAVLAIIRALAGGGLPQLGAGPEARGPQQEGTYRPGELGDLDELLDQVDVVAARPERPGYDRECGTGHACSFGPDWSDDTDTPLAHNGCDTRNDMLDRALTAPILRPGTNGCVVIAGRLTDPYTGEPIEFRKEAAHEVGVDHLYPLARAWDLGAADWTPKTRATFANDPANLVVVSGSANSSKSDQGPGEWLPMHAAYRCTYVARYLQVAIAYGLPITRGDHDAAQTLAPRCRPA